MFLISQSRISTKSEIEIKSGIYSPFPLISIGISFEMFLIKFVIILAYWMFAPYHTHKKFVM